MSEHLSEDQDDADLPADGDDLAGAPSPAASGPLLFEISEALEGERLDKALALLAPAGLSRSRLRALVEGGAAERDGEVVRDPRAKVKAGEAYVLDIPAPAPARPEPESIPLTVVYEDAHLIVVDKPAGMVVHPAPGAMTGTLVNALLAHCAGSLSGVGGEARPGIVHRIDKDTSGLLVVAKSDAAHHGLSERFAAHDLERTYQAFAWSAPLTSDPRALGLPGVEDEGGGWLRVETRIDRHRSDRKRMAVARGGGRIAISHMRTLSHAGPATRPIVSRVSCRLETGRTHQIRVHMSWLGCPLVGDATYGGRSRKAPGELAGEALAGFPLQALHAATLGFDHPVTGEPLRFEAPLPADMQALAEALGL